MPRIIVERSFDPPLSQEDLNAAFDRVGNCLDLYNVRYIRSRLSADRRRMVCEFEGADAQSVRDVQNTAQMPFDRVWPADVIGRRLKAARGSYPPSRSWTRAGGPAVRLREECCVDDSMS